MKSRGLVLGYLLRFLTIASLLSAVFIPLAPASIVQASANNTYEIIVLPDTQYYANNQTAIFNAQTSWIHSNLATRNIVAVAHVGDVVDNGADTALTDNASHAMGLIDGVPQVVINGNHDRAWQGDNSTTNFESVFPDSRYNAYSWWGGSDNLSRYINFSLGTNQFLMIGLPWVATADDLAWANSIVSANPSKRVIVVTHEYLNTNGTRSAVGTDIWTNFVKLHSNIFMVLSGHNYGGGTGAASNNATGDNSNTVFELMANYQDFAAGGSGYLRILQFNTTTDQINVSTYSPWNGASLTDSTNQFTLSYAMTDAPYTSTGWWDTNFKNRVKINLVNPGLSSNLTSFPFLVSLNATNFDFSIPNNQGLDLRFVDNDDVTPLYSENETYNKAGAVANIWVQKPTLKGAATDYIWLYYNNPSNAYSGFHSVDVWKSSYDAVYHMADTVGDNTTIQDSTINNRDGTKSGGAVQVAGTIGYAQQLNGTDGFVNIAAFSVDGDAMTIEAIVKSTDLAGRRTFYGNNNTNELPFIEIGNYQGEGTMTAVKPGLVLSATNAGTIIANTAQIVAYTKSGKNDTHAFYISGEPVALQSNVSENYSSVAESKQIGQRGNNANWFNGDIDEFRISSENFSADWLKATYLSESAGLVSGITSPSLAVSSSAATGVSYNKDGTITVALNGSLTDLGASYTANVSFEWGLTDSYGSETSIQALTSTIAFTDTSLAALTTIGQTYHFRAKAVNESGTVYGTDQSFSLTLPTLTSSAFTGVTYDGSTVAATFNGNITNMGSASNVDTYFEYGTTTAYGSVTSTVTRSIAGAFTYNFSSATWGVNVHARPVIKIGATYIYGNDQSSTIPPRTDKFTALTTILFVTPSVLFLSLLVICLGTAIKTRDIKLRVLSILMIVIMIDVFLIFINALNNLISGQW